MLKNLAIFMLVAMNLTQAEKHRISELVGALFSLPFILFSMAGGFLADRFSKRTISVGVKVFEIAVMLLALAGLISGKHAGSACLRIPDGRSQRVLRTIQVRASSRVAA